MLNTFSQRYCQGKKVSTIPIQHCTGSLTIIIRQDIRDQNMNKEKGKLSVFRNDIIFMKKILKEYKTTTSPEK